MSAGKLIKTILVACLLPLAAEATVAGPHIDWQETCAFPAAAGVDPARLRCGILTVSLDWNAPETGVVRLPVAVIRTLSTHPEPDPVVFLSGGPGGAPTSSAHSFTLFSSHAFGQDRDIVLFTQRGAESTEPELRCDALRDARLGIVADDLTLAERDKRIADAARGCLKSLQASGIPLHSFSAAQNARDMLALREALGVKRWNLLGVSYGTYMALEAARIDPGGVRSMVLDSVVSPESDLFMSEASRNFERGLTRVFDACAADSACHAAFPTLSDDLDTILVRLATSPVAVTLTGKAGPVQVLANDHDFLSLLHWMLYSPKALPLVPLVIDRTAKGDTALLVRLMDSVYPAPATAGDSAAGAFFAIVCEDQYRPSRGADPGKGRFGSFAITSFMRAVCPDPTLGYGRDHSPAPVTVKVPTLILTGRFDPMTPDLYAEEIAATLPASRLIRVGNWGHSTLSGYTECQTDIAAAFLANPDIDLPPQCGLDNKTVVFITDWVPE